MGKVYFIILDGAADRPLKILSNRTPLKAARKPHLDSLACRGQQSMINILPEGFVPESDSGAMALLGYDPMKYYCGRGMLESLGVGVGIDYKYHAGFRINFATLNEKRTNLLDRRVARGLSAEELQELTSEIVNGVRLGHGDKVRFHLHTFGSFRGILSFYSDEICLTGNVSNTDPAYRKKGFFSIPVENYSSVLLPCKAEDESMASENTARLVNLFSKQCMETLGSSQVNRKRILEGKMPANCILVRDGGSSKIQMPNFKERCGKTLSIYGQLPCEKALAQLIGARFYYTWSFDKQVDGEYLRDLARVLYQDESDIVFCHLKGPDEPGHDKKPFKKVEAIEIIDQYFIGEIRRNLTDSDRVIVTCDHATPCELGVHSDDAVPLLLYGSEIPKDSSISFDEKSAEYGSCPVKEATKIMDYIKE